ncbi:MAG: hypothetical protein MJZ49_03770 [Bacteroidales bacterium]|nr:hypothetical protein [Bacteroidales bacterium]
MCVTLPAPVQQSVTFPPMKPHHSPIKNLLFGILLLLPYGLSAQNDAPLRVELPAAKDKDDYHCVLADTNGAVVFYEAQQVAWDTVRWVFLQYDTNLVKKRQFIMNFPPETEFVASTLTENSIYILLQKKLPKKDPPRSFIIQLDLIQNTHHIVELSGLNDRFLADLAAIDGQLAIISKDTKNDDIYFYNLIQNKIIHLNDIFTYKIHSCTADTANHRWLVALFQSKNGAIEDLYFYEYNWLTDIGNLLTLPQKMSDGTEISLQTARFFPLNADSTLLIGTYNTHIDTYSNGLHSGVYTTFLHGNDFDTLKTFNYTGLRTGNTTPSKSSNPNLQLQIGRTSHNDKQFSIMAEVFYPDYTYSYQSAYDYYSYAHPTTSTVFLGYQFVNAYITTFDRNGNLLWDNYFLLDNISIMHLEPVLSMDFLGEDALIYYPRGNRIYNTLVNGYTTLEKISYFNVETSSPRDLVEYNKNTEIQRWYGDNY